MRAVQKLDDVTASLGFKTQPNHNFSFCFFLPRKTKLKNDDHLYHK